MISWLCCFDARAKAAASHGRNAQQKTVAHLVSVKEEHGLLEGLSVKSSSEPSGLDAWSPLVVLFWKVLQILESRILLEEVGHWVLTTGSVLSWALLVSLFSALWPPCCELLDGSPPRCHDGQMPLRW